MGVDRHRQRAAAEVPGAKERTAPRGRLSPQSATRAWDIYDVRMGYPQRLLTEGEEIIREFRPHWRLLVIPLGWSLVMIAVIVLTWAFPPDVVIVDFVVTAAAIVGLVVLGIYPPSSRGGLPGTY